MVRIEKATVEDAEGLTEVQTRTFLDDNVRKPPGCSMEGPPGYDSVEWNVRWIEQTHYYKTLYRGYIVGGLILFEMGERHCELGRIYVDSGQQDRGIGQQAMRFLSRAFPQVSKWMLGTPSWATRNQHFYEKLGL